MNSVQRCVQLRIAETERLRHPQKRAGGRGPTAERRPVSEWEMQEGGRPG